MADLFGARQLDVPLPVANGPPCQTHNLRLFSFLRAATEEVRPLTGNLASHARKLTVVFKAASHHIAEEVKDKQNLFINLGLRLIV
jgi:hypothetical protein